MNPDICLSDEAEWLEKMRKQRVSLSRNPKTNNYNVGLFNYDSTNNDMSTTENACNCAWNWRSELPVIILLVVVILFVVYFWRKYREHKRRNAIRESVVGYSSMDRARPYTVQMFQQPQNRGIDYQAYGS